MHDLNDACHIECAMCHDNAPLIKDRSEDLYPIGFALSRACLLFWDGIIKSIVMCVLSYVMEIMKS